MPVPLDIMITRSDDYIPCKQKLNYADNKVKYMSDYTKYQESKLLASVVGFAELIYGLFWQSNIHYKYSIHHMYSQI